MQDSFPGKSVPFLMYHQVTPLPPAGFEKYCVTPQTLARQMDWLVRAGYTSITLDTLLAWRQGRTLLPLRPVVITFDDGFRECLHYAMPILGTRGLAATFYMVAGLVGRTSRWLEEERGLSIDMAGWDLARDMSHQGFTCGAHSLTHPHLADLAEGECREELARSRQLLQDRLDVEIRHLAYPFGSYDARVQTLVIEQGYASACSVNTGLSWPGDDLYALHRVPITGYDSLPDFMWKVLTARSPRDWLQRMLRRTRRRLELAGHPK